MNYQDFNNAYAAQANEGGAGWELDDIIDAPIAIMADLAVTTVNSLTTLATFGQAGTDFDTKELLTGLGADDAVKFYDDHTDATQLGSFVAGILIPGLGISKALTAAKSGKLGILGQPFKKLDDNIVGYRTKSLEARSSSIARTTAETSAKRMMYANTAVMGVAENAVYEIGMLGLLNQHTYLEEYSLGDAALSMAIGSAVGVPLLAWGAHGALTKGQIAVDAMQTERLGDTLFRKYSSENLPLGTSVAAYKALAESQIDVMKSGLRADEVAVIESRLKETKAEMRKTLINMFPEADRKALSAAIPKGELDELVDFDKLIERGIDVFDDKITDVEILAKLVNDEAAALVKVAKAGKFTGKSSGISPDFKDYYKLEQKTGNLEIFDSELNKIISQKHAGKSTKFAEHKYGAHGEINIIVKNDTTIEDIANTLGMQGLQGRPMKLVSIGKKPPAMKTMKEELDLLVPNKASATWTDDIMQDKIFTTEQALKEYGAVHAARATVVDSWSGLPTVMDSLEAKVAQGVADYGGTHKTVGKPELYKASTLKGNFNPSVASVWASDSEFYAANIKIHALSKLDASGTRSYLVAADDLPRLQAIRNAAINKQAFNVSTTNAGSKEINTLRELDVAINKARAKHVKSMVDGGFSELSIMKATNTSREGMAKLQSGQYKAEALEGFTTDSYRYNRAGSEKYMNLNQLELKGENVKYFDRWQQYRQASDTDLQSLETMFKAQTAGIIDKATAGGALPEVRMLADQILSQDDAMRPLLKDINSPALTGTGFFSSNAQSLDHAFRRTEMLGAKLSTMGANLKVAANAMSKRMQDKIHAPLNAINESNAARTAFGYLRQATDAMDNDMAKGLRYDPAVGKFVLKEADEVNDVVYMKNYGSQDDWVVAGDTKILMENFLKEWLPVQGELFEMLNVAKGLQGARRATGRGFWLPYGRIDEANIAYKIDALDPNNVTMIRARGAEELKSTVNKLRMDNSSGNIKYVTRAELDDWNVAHKRAALDELGRADAAKEKSGVAFDAIPADGRGIQEVIDGVQEAVWTRSRAIVENGMPDTMNTLKAIIKEQDAAYKSSKGTPFQRLGKNTSAAKKAYAALMNIDNVSESVLLEAVNNGYSHIVDSAGLTIKRLIGKHHIGDEAAQDKAYKAFLNDLTKENIPNPFKDTADYINSLAPERRSIALEKTQEVNSFAAMFALRFFDLSHAAITAMSMPVILAGELSSKTYAGLDNGAVMPIKYMMQGIKMAMKKGNNAADDAVMLRAKELGYTRAQIAETTDAFQSMHLDPTWIDNLAKNEFVEKFITKPSDWMEGMVREVSYATGYSLAKDKFPKANAADLEAWAHNFTNRTMGNYITKQRPAMFQGTFGSAMGLFQTFMLTMGQNLIRYAEVGDTRAISTLMAGQTAMFGMGSLPGYDQMNHLIGNYVNEDSHSDLTGFTERLFGSEDKRDLAEYMLYGLPSTLTQAAMYTRAELQPRSPIGVDTEGAVNFAAPGISAVFNLASDAVGIGRRVVAEATSGGDILDMGRAVREGLATQTLFRPLSRYTELLQGYSQDRTGQVVDENTMDGFFPIFARIMGSRPLQEQALRQLKFENSYYNQADSDKRKEYAKVIRSSVASDSNHKQSKLFQNYMDAGGSASGYTKIWNDAYLYNMKDANYADRITRDAGNKGAMIDIMSNYST